MGPEGYVAEQFFLTLRVSWRLADLFAAWDAHRARTGGGVVDRDYAVVHAAQAEAVSRDSAGFAALALHCYVRALKQHSRAKMNLFSDVLLLLVAACALSAVCVGPHAPPRVGGCAVTRFRCRMPAGIGGTPCTPPRSRHKCLRGAPAHSLGRASRR